MAFKRALWSSGYNYHITCNYCGTKFSYVDRQLDFRPWFPNGFIYCPRCRKPLRHSEIFAVHPDGTPVYSSLAEAEQAINVGYLNALGQPASQVPVPPSVPTAGTPSVSPSEPREGVSYCTQCGHRYVIGTDHFCSSCGRKLD